MISGCKINVNRQEVTPGSFGRGLQEWFIMEGTGEADREVSGQAGQRPWRGTEKMKAFFPAA